MQVPQLLVSDLAKLATLHWPSVWVWVQMRLVLGDGLLVSATPRSPHWRRSGRRSWAGGWISSGFPGPTESQSQGFSPWTAACSPTGFFSFPLRLSSSFCSPPPQTVPSLLHIHHRHVFCVCSMVAFWNYIQTDGISQQRGNRSHKWQRSFLLRRGIINCHCLFADQLSWYWKYYYSRCNVGNSKTRWHNWHRVGQ